MIIELGEWLPDLPALNNPGCTKAKGVIPDGTTYCPFLDKTVYSDALDARTRGAISVRDSEGTSHNFAGDAAKLSKLSDGIFSDVSVSGGYSTAAEERWFLTKVGQDVIATNFSDAIQTYTLNSSSLFANLSGSPPKARYMDKVTEFLVVGNTWDSVDGNVPNRVRWAGIGTTTSWTVSSTTQADYQDLDSNGGWVRQVVGGEYGVIFQERAITRMEYEGQPTVFRFDQVERGRGTNAPGSVVKVGNFIFYLGIDGFYIFDGAQSHNIGFSKVDQTFYDEFDDNYFDRVVATYDPTQQIIFLIYPTSSATDGRPDRVLMYNYSRNATLRWSFADLDTDHIYLANGEPATLEEIGSQYAELEDVPFSFDSRFWAGESNLLSCFDHDNKLCYFQGSPLSAVLETKEGQLTEARRTRLLRVRPLIEGDGTVTLQIGARNKQTESVTWGSVHTLNDSGDAAVRSNARYHRARINVSGNFDFCRGIEIVEIAPGGMR